MDEKFLGKIDFAEFGKISDFPFLIGLQLGFSFNGYGVMDGGKYTVNIDDACKWSTEERLQGITKSVEKVNEILTVAKCCYVSELINKPVEVVIENGVFSDFRILTEVL